MITTNYGLHVQHLQQLYEQALSLPEIETNGIESVLVHSGSEDHYYGDDRGIPFQAFGHFGHWLPVNRPDQFLLIGQHKRPTYYQIVPGDYWYDQSIDLNNDIADNFDIVRLESVAELARKLPAGNIAYLGESAVLAESFGIAKDSTNPTRLNQFLDFQRAYKTEYELEQLRSANEQAVLGHKAARECFLDGGNEYQIHMAYLNASQQLEDESPYTNIVALDDKSAILHYQYKRREIASQRQVLLIDAGCRVNGYGSDITRTWTKGDIHPRFKELLKGVDTIEQSLVSRVRPGIAYPDLHLDALEGLADLLIETGICAGSASELMEQEVPQLFMPHGVGHLLGIQVHDVGGHQVNVKGEIAAPPAHSPALRNTRELQENMVFTIEPGCYFIPMLLEPERSSSRGSLIDWNSVDELYDCGGIRIEDNVCVTSTGAENLTRQFDIV